MLPLCQLEHCTDNRNSVSEGHTLACAKFERICFFAGAKDALRGSKFERSTLRYPWYEPWHRRRSHGHDRHLVSRSQVWRTSRKGRRISTRILPVNQRRSLVTQALGLDIAVVRMIENCCAYRTSSPRPHWLAVSIAPLPCCTRARNKNTQKHTRHWSARLGGTNIAQEVILLNVLT